MDGDQTSQEQSSIPAVDLPPVLLRVKIVIGRLAAYSQAGGNGKYARFAWVMESMTDEILDELADMDTDQEQMMHWFDELGQVMAWCGHGDDSRLPDSVRPYLQQEVRQRLAITAGN